MRIGRLKPLKYFWLMADYRGNLAKTFNAKTPSAKKQDEKASRRAELLSSGARTHSANFVFHSATAYFSNLADSLAEGATLVDENRED
jgi:hypothetical protein